MKLQIVAYLVALQMIADLMSLVKLLYRNIYNKVVLECNIIYIHVG